MTVIIANAIDFVAALIQVGSGSIKQKSKILVVQILQLFLQGISMLLLGGITGAISNVLSCFRNYICYKGKLNRIWKAVFIILSIAMTVLFNDQGLLGMLPAAVCTVYIIFMDVKDPIKFKLLVTLSFIPWLIYHFALGSYVGAIVDAATIVTSVITLYTMIRSKKNAKERSQ